MNVFYQVRFKSEGESISFSVIANNLRQAIERCLSVLPQQDRFNSLGEFIIEAQRIEDKLERHELFELKLEPNDWAYSIFSIIKGETYITTVKGDYENKAV
jgi:hypothetical protein